MEAGGVEARWGVGGGRGVDRPAASSSTASSGSALIKAARMYFIGVPQTGSLEDARTATSYISR